MGQGQPKMVLTCSSVLLRIRSALTGCWCLAGFRGIPAQEWGEDRPSLLSHRPSGTVPSSLQVFMEYKALFLPAGQIESVFL